MPCQRAKYAGNDKAHGSRGQGRGLLVWKHGVWLLEIPRCRPLFGVIPSNIRHLAKLRIPFQSKDWGAIDILARLNIEAGIHVVAILN